jgi:hypothetical protein
MCLFGANANIQIIRWETAKIAKSKGNARDVLQLSGLCPLNHDNIFFYRTVGAMPLELSTPFTPYRLGSKPKTTRKSGGSQPSKPSRSFQLDLVPEPRELQHGMNGCNFFFLLLVLIPVTLVNR